MMTWEALDDKIRQTALALSRRKIEEAIETIRKSSLTLKATCGIPPAEVDEWVITLVAEAPETGEEQDVNSQEEP